MSDALDAVFEMTKVDDGSYAIKEPDELPSEVVPVDENNTEDEDFKYSRKNQYDLIEVGKAGVQTALRIASESEQPRAIETLALMLKTASEMNKQLVLMTKDKAEAKAAKKGQATGVPQQIGNQTNNTIVMTGTMQDMLDQLKLMKTQ